ncbi:hypothetical protein Bca101_067159 [Brassica carinata]
METESSIAIIEILPLSVYQSNKDITKLPQIFPNEKTTPKDALRTNKRELVVATRVYKHYVAQELGN